MALDSTAAIRQELEVTMKNDSSSSRVIAFNSLPYGARFTTVRHTFTALFVASLLSGCTSLKTLPEKVNLDVPANTGEFRNRVYVGAGMGSSRFSPRTDGALSADVSGDMGTQLRIGYDVHNMFAVEFDTSVLGEATLESAGTPNSTGRKEVSYSAAGLSALVYGWSGVQMRSRREGLSAYGRFGFTSLKKSSNVIGMEDSGVVPVLGIGAEYGFASGLGVRAEITRFDSDTSYVGVGAVYRFGISPKGIGRMIADAAEPVLNSKGGKVAKGDGSSQHETVVERYAGPNARPGNGSAPHLRHTKGAEPDAKYVGSMAERWRPAMRSDDRDVDGVLDHSDSCPDTDKHVTVDRYGCGLFDAVLHEVTFKSSSAWLTPRARAQLNLLGETLLAFPEARIQVRAHTDSFGTTDKNLDLSSRRAEVVVQYLQSRGINELQLQAVGIGEAQPLDTNATSKGRKRNRRVDIVTLPDQDAGQLLVASRDSANAGTTPANGKADRPIIDLSAVAEPDMEAANPHAASGFVKKRPKVRTVNRAMAIVDPLPQPGVAPNFPFTGVLFGVSFARGEAMLAEESRRALQPLVEALQREASVKIAIMAHTDNQGGREKNKALSTDRATAVAQYLIEQGVDGNRLKPEGYGELLPLVQNVTDADRRRNRRIEVRVLP